MIQDKKSDGDPRSPLGCRHIPFSLLRFRPGQASPFGPFLLGASFFLHLLAGECRLCLACLLLAFQPGLSFLTLALLKFQFRKRLQFAFPAIPLCLFQAGNCFTRFAFFPDDRFTGFTLFADNCRKAIALLLAQFIC